MILYDTKVSVPNMEEVNSLSFLGEEDEIPEDLKLQRHRLPGDHKKAVHWLREVALCSRRCSEASQCCVSWLTLTVSAPADGILCDKCYAHNKNSVSSLGN